MNLWVNHLRQLSVLAVAFLFLACEDETSLLGFKNPNTKFDLRYVDIPLGNASSILLLDSIRASNFVTSSDLDRLLIGEYIDPEFGNMSATAFAQFITSTTTKLPSDVMYGSVSLKLALDLYNYGSKEISAHTIQVYEIEEELDQTNKKNYFTKTDVAFNQSPLGTKEFYVSPVEYEKLQKAGKDTTFNVLLSPEFGQRIFQSAIRYRDAGNREDSTFVLLSEFPKLFKGIAIQLASADLENGGKMLRINPAKSSIVLHYHKAGSTDSLFHSLTIGYPQLLNFNKITADRSSTDLAGLTFYNPVSEMQERYIQSGAGIVTKLNLNDFFAFADTVPNIQISNAELIIEGIEAGDYAPPSHLALRVLSPNNRQKIYVDKEDPHKRDVRLYKGFLSFDADVYQGGNIARPALIDNDSVYYVLTDGGSGSALTYSAEKKSYVGYISSFLQQMVKTDDGRTRFENFILYPANPSASKSVNRVVFDRDKIKLRIHYTKPTVNTD